MINEINDARREQPAGIGQTRVAVSQRGDVTQHNATLVETARTSRTSMEGASRRTAGEGFWLLQTSLTLLLTTLFSVPL